MPLCIPRIAACLALGLVVMPAAAQEYPTRAAKIIVPFAAGGPADVYARFLAQRQRDALGQPFVIEDRPGAGSVTGTDAVAKAAPDGHALLLMSNAQTVNCSSPWRAWTSCTSRTRAVRAHAPTCWEDKSR